ncbi:hypothetical protein NEF87_000879 [Candidatus Lokiarchaeum ossiferum]|uniref:Histidine kinase N-terminal 7TM region domain-containing protein n=1 Tax=Candidatus Lokiarchaeum ossiferum TaxID=2951803 RepID=A0ABY6HQ52_9ARCH|nr:hypothetical protein NEF87_000879 [Candidatus Lokiarchaeum sp. B-35]
MLEWLEFVFEGIAIVASYLSAIVVLRKNSKYIGNQLMFVTFFLFGTYILSLLTYGIIKTEIVIHILFRVGINCLLYGMLFLFFTMQVMVHSSGWINNKNHILPFIIPAGLWSIWTIFAHLEILSIDPVNTSMALPPLIFLILSSFGLLISSIISLYKYGIKETKGENRKKMLIFMVGLSINLIALLISLAAQLESEGILMDIIFFVVLACGLVIVAYGFTRNTKIK